MHLKMYLALMKEKYHKACLSYLETRIETLQQDIQAIRNDLESETKSSAGDKYETSREMMKQEENKALASLSLLKNQLYQLTSLKIESTTKVALGSLVRTDKGIFYISVALGKIPVEDNDFFAISTEAPLYKVLYGKKVGDVVGFNGNTFQVQEVM